MPLESPVCVLMSVCKEISTVFVPLCTIEPQHILWVCNSIFLKRVIEKDAFLHCILSNSNLEFRLYLQLGNSEPWVTSWELRPSMDVHIKPRSVPGIWLPLLGNGLSSPSFLVNRVVSCPKLASYFSTETVIALPWVSVLPWIVWSVCGYQTPNSGLSLTVPELKWDVPCP